MTVHDLAGRPVLLDSNLSILLCVGLAGPKYLRAHKRAIDKKFDEIDFLLLQALLGKSSQIVVCPNVATETSNLLRQTYEALSRTVSEIQGRLLQEWQEIYMESARAVSDPDYLRLGVTDVALLQILTVSPELVLLTVDFDLYLAGANRSLSVCNFNHLRDQRTDFA